MAAEKAEGPGGGRLRRRQDGKTELSAVGGVGTACRKPAASTSATCSPRQQGAPHEDLDHIVTLPCSDLPRPTAPRTQPGSLHRTLLRACRPHLLRILSSVLGPGRPSLSSSHLSLCLVSFPRDLLSGLTQPASPPQPRAGDWVMNFQGLGLRENNSCSDLSILPATYGYSHIN